jgi:hypothetical protein
MDRNKQITVAAILTLAIAGCTVGESPTPEATTTPAPATTPTQPSSAVPGTPPQAATPGVNTQNPPKASNAAFNNPLVAGKDNSQTPSTNITTSTNLIQPTDPKVRLDTLITGRRDPFAQIVTSTPPLQLRGTNTPKTPNKFIPPPALPSTIRKTPSKNPNNPLTIKNPNNPSTIKKPSKPGTTQPSIRRVAPPVLPQVAPNPTLVPLLPTAAKPEAAQAVGVAGVILIGREPKAIIKVPEETTSRYVQAGQRLANGVLVKRIEMNQGINPVVILEQNGIEVVKSVGDKPGNKTANTNSPQLNTGNSV